MNIQHTRRKLVVEALRCERLGHRTTAGVTPIQIWRRLEVEDEDVTYQEFGQLMRELISDNTLVVTIQYSTAGRKAMTVAVMDLALIPPDYNFTNGKYVDTLGRPTYVPLVYLRADSLPEQVKQLVATSLGA